MASFVERLDGSVGLPETHAPERTDRAADETRLEHLHARVAPAVSMHSPAVASQAFATARLIAAAGADSAAGDHLAAGVYASEIVVRLAADGQLDTTDTRLVVDRLAEARDEPAAAAALALYLRSVSSPRLSELPPLVAIEIQANFL